MAAIRGILFTDLDGTLLDHDTYVASEQAVRIIASLERNRVRTIPVTSKTAAEVTVLMPELGIDGWAVVEGGGVVVRGDGAEKLTADDDRSVLIEALRAVADEGFAVRGAHQMDPPEFARRTGLSEERAAQALTRRASEPFVFEDHDHRTPDMVAALIRQGVSVTRGGRFWHLQAIGVDKAMGARRVMDLLGVGEDVRCGAVGDAWNDLPLLAWADCGYLLGSAVSTSDVPSGVQRIAAGGPVGFEVAAGRFAAALGLRITDRGD